MTEPLTLADVEAAAARIAPYVETTPLLTAPLLDEEIGFHLLVKAENLQPVGAFKLRGAFNQILQLTEEERRRGIIAVSSGNHAQAVAFAARAMGVSATIVMPRDAPRVKLERTKALGAHVEFFDRLSNDRDALTRRLAEQGGLRFIHPYDDPRTIAGQGTIGLEIFAQTRAKGVAPDAIIASCSGGGLASGIALTLPLFERAPQLCTAEPAGFDDMRRSLENGAAQVNAALAGSICDALLAPTPGRHTLPILLACGACGLTATDAQVEDAMRIAAEHFRIVLEPGGAAALACALIERDRFAEKTVVVVASGGNVDRKDFAAILDRPHHSI
ncbi:MAG TPA: threonine/serine dehydratase [Methylosinus sp.]|jgi:threonine dehydratase|uniref:threonine ammonia-lyase n=1 Tax=Methylosinus sp. TaxID=427 RepID=UPI002F935CDA